MGNLYSKTTVSKLPITPEKNIKKLSLPSVQQSSDELEIVGDDDVFMDPRSPSTHISRTPINVCIY